MDQLQSQQGHPHGIQGTFEVFDSAGQKPMSMLATLKIEAA
ncbi:hypothetical protein [Corynebacterium glutamicum]|nr:hypothetical protein [Corynebacterium glutamicum]